MKPTTLIIVAAIAVVAISEAMAERVWIGTAPFCAASREDCTSRGLRYVRSDSRGDGKKCWKGKKVLCETVPLSPQETVVERVWFGTAPFCAGDPLDCTARGMRFVRSDRSGDGAACKTGTKVLCERTSKSPPLRKRQTWIGTAPICAGKPSDCELRAMRYVRSHTAGDGEACVTGKKVLCECEVPEDSRPFYVIAHRANSPTDVATALRDGANAVEFDVRFSSKHQKFCVNHDTTLFCDRDDLVLYLREVKQLANKYGEQLAMIIMDFKDADGNANAGADLMTIVRRELTADTGVKAILSVPKLSMVAVLDTVKPGAGEGLAVDAENDVDRVAKYFKNRDIGRAVFGNGTFVAGIEINIEDSIRKAVSLRSVGSFRFVYVWTLGSESSMASYMSIGVNGILVNTPAELRSVLGAWCLPVRLAVRSDNPFH
jgi:glycerophosphoryl diester phosphodiesterase